MTFTQLTDIADSGISISEQGLLNSRGTPAVEEEGSFSTGINMGIYSDKIFGKVQKQKRLTLFWK